MQSLLVIGGRDKILVPKLNSLWKHVGRRKAIIVIPSVAMGNYYTLKMNQHVINEWLFVARGRQSMVQQMVVSVVVESEKNFFNLH